MSCCYLGLHGLIPLPRKLGFWIVEPLVDRSTEFYPRGGIKQLVRYKWTG